MKTTIKHLQQQLKEDTAALAMPKGRRVGQPGHDKAESYLRDRMDEIGLIPFKGDDFGLPYDGRLRDEARGKAHRFMNLVGLIPGRDRDLPPLLIGAHYDSVIDAPCADDNATSVALNLAIAEIFAPESMFAAPKLERDLIIAFFDAEEPPYFLGQFMGSNRFVEDHCDGMKFAGVIVTDLIGHDLDVSWLAETAGLSVPGLGLATRHLKDTVFLTGCESDAVLPEVIESVSEETKGLRIFPTLHRYVGGMSDHAAFARAGHPFLFFSCAQGRYYHHEKDTLDWINFAKLERITNFIAKLLVQLDETPAGDAPYEEDPAEFESRMIRKVLGKPLTMLLKKAGIEPPNNRDEIDQTIQSLIGGFV